MRMFNRSRKGKARTPWPPVTDPEPVGYEIETLGTRHHTLTLLHRDEHGEPDVSSAIGHDVFGSLEKAHAEGRKWVRREHANWAARQQQNIRQVFLYPTLPPVGPAGDSKATTQCRHDEGHCA